MPKGDEKAAENPIPHVALSVDDGDVNRGALRILQHIRPTWQSNDIETKLLTDGITNKLVMCKPKDGNEEDTVLIRVYGHKTDLLIDRKAETRNIILLSKINLAPDLYATFDNGLAYQFIPGCTLNTRTVTDPNIYALVATRMAKLHKVQVPGQSHPKPFLWDKVQAFLDLVPEIFSDSKKNQRFQEMVIPKREIQEEARYLRSVLEPVNSPIVFAHNDLLLGNVIFTEDKNCVTFIDYEYAGFNYQAFDIGNHFAEFVGIDNIDYDQYPNEELQKNWLRAYLTEYKGTFTEKDVQNLYVQVNKFALASHLFWGIWALIQAEHSHIDFDFIEYGATRINEYLARKDIFLNLSK